MYESLYEDLTLAKMADYDRIVNRLLLEREALSAAAQPPATTESRRRHLPWAFGSRRPTALN